MPKGEWSIFFATAAGAAAALAGLAIVAISVNVARILSHPRLPARAAATVGALIVALVVSLAALMPQSMAALALEVLAFGLAGWLLQLWSAARTVLARAEPRATRPQAILAVLLGQAQAAPILLGGALLMAGQAGGLPWLAFGILATFTGAALNCWVLLVEILR